MKMKDIENIIIDKTVNNICENFWRGKSISRMSELERDIFVKIEHKIFSTLWFSFGRMNRNNLRDNI